MGIYKLHTFFLVSIYIRKVLLNGLIGSLFATKWYQCDKMIYCNVELMKYFLQHKSLNVIIGFKYVKAFIVNG